MESDRTKDFKKKRNLFGLLSYGTWLITALVFIISAFAAISTEDAELVNESMQIVTDEAKNWIIGLGTTAIIAIAGAIIIKDKIRTVIWMVTLVLAVILYAKVGMFIVLGLWLVDEYVFTQLFHHYCHKVSINKEIDARE